MFLSVGIQIQTCVQILRMLYYSCEECRLPLLLIYHKLYLVVNSGGVQTISRNLGSNSKTMKVIGWEPLFCKVQTLEGRFIVSIFLYSFAP